MVVPASAAAVEIVTANPAGAAWTALAASTTPRLAALVVTSRRFKKSSNSSSDSGCLPSYWGY
jgi:hypothetical protein